MFIKDVMEEQTGNNVLNDCKLCNGITQKKHKNTNNIKCKSKNINLLVKRDDLNNLMKLIKPDDSPDKPKPGKNVNVVVKTLEIEKKPKSSLSNFCESLFAYRFPGKKKTNTDASKKAEKCNCVPIRVPRKIISVKRYSAGNKVRQGSNQSTKNSWPFVKAKSEVSVSDATNAGKQISVDKAKSQSSISDSNKPKRKCEQKKETLAYSFSENWEKHIELLKEQLKWEVSDTSKNKKPAYETKSEKSVHKKVKQQNRDSSNNRKSAHVSPSEQTSSSSSSKSSKKDSCDNKKLALESLSEQTSSSSSNGRSSKKDPTKKLAHESQSEQTSSRSSKKDSSINRKRAHESPSEQTSSSSSSKKDSSNNNKLIDESRTEHTSRNNIDSSNNNKPVHESRSEQTNCKKKGSSNKNKPIHESRPEQTNSIKKDSSNNKKPIQQKQPEQISSNKKDSCNDKKPVDESKPKQTSSNKKVQHTNKRKKKTFKSKERKVSDTDKSSSKSDVCKECNILSEETTTNSGSEPIIDGGRSSILVKGVKRKENKRKVSFCDHVSDKYTLGKFRQSKEKHPTKLSNLECKTLRRYASLLPYDDDNHSETPDSPPDVGEHTFNNAIKRVVLLSPKDSSIRPKRPITVIRLPPDRAKLVWNSPSEEGFLNINGYIIERKEMEENQWQYVGEVPAQKGRMEMIVEGLNPAKNYIFGIAASTCLGVSKPVIVSFPPENELSSQLSSRVLSGGGDANQGLKEIKRSRLKVTKTSNTSVKLAWQMPTVPVQEYIVAKQDISTNQWTVVGQVPGDTVSPQIIVCDLQPGKIYNFRVDSKGVIPPIVCDQPISIIAGNDNAYQQHMDSSHLWSKSNYQSQKDPKLCQTSQSNIDNKSYQISQSCIDSLMENPTSKCSLEVQKSSIHTQTHIRIYKDQYTQYFSSDSKDTLSTYGSIRYRIKNANCGKFLKKNKKKYTILKKNIYIEKDKKHSIVKLKKSKDKLQSRKEETKRKRSYSTVGFNEMQRRKLTAMYENLMRECAEDDNRSNQTVEIYGKDRSVERTPCITDTDEIIVTNYEEIGDNLFLLNADQSRTSSKRSLAINDRNKINIKPTSSSKLSSKSYKKLQRIKELIKLLNYDELDIQSLIADDNSVENKVTKKESSIQQEYLQNSKVKDKKTEGVSQSKRNSLKKFLNSSTNRKKKSKEKSKLLNEIIRNTLQSSSKMLCDKCSSPCNHFKNTTETSLQNLTPSNCIQNNNLPSNINLNNTTDVLKIVSPLFTPMSCESITSTQDVSKLRTYDRQIYLPAITDLDLIETSVHPDISRNINENSDKNNIRIIINKKYKI